MSIHEKTSATVVERILMYYPTKEKFQRLKNRIAYHGYMDVSRGGELKAEAAEEHIIDMDFLESLAKLLYK